MLKGVKWLVLLSVVVLAGLLSSDTGKTAPPGPTISILSPAEGKTVWTDGTLYSVRIVFKAWDADNVNAGAFSLSVDGGGYSAISVTAFDQGGRSGFYYYDWLPISGSKAYSLRIEGVDGDANSGYSREINVNVKIKAVDSNGIFPGDGKLLVRDNDNNVCMSCHGLKSHSSASLQSTKYGNWERVCRDCHTPHNTPNIFLLQTSFRIFTGINQNYAYSKKVDFRNISGESTYGFVTKTGTARRGPCEVCHTRTSNADSTPRWRNWTSEPDTDGDKHNTGITCIYCHPHDDGFQVKCNVCHGTPPFTNNSGVDGYASFKGNSYLASGVFLDESQTPHYKHAVTYPFGDKGVGYGKTGRCRACHSNDANLHMNTVYQNVNFGLYSTTGDGRNYNPATRQCAVYCHSDGGPWDGTSYTMPNFTSPTWGAPGILPGATQCEGCHNYPPQTNRHTTHAGVTSNYGLDCSNCHFETVVNYTTIKDPLAEYHVNKVKDVIFGDIAQAGGALPSFDVATHRCKNVYCHGNFVNGNNTTIQWNGESPCGSCHDVPNNKLSHYKHVTIYLLDCANCHESTMNDDNNYSIAGYDTHVDGSKTIEFGLARAALIDNTLGAGAGDPTQCENIYCHSRGTDQVAPFDDPDSAPNMTPTWGDSIGCNYCHGNNDYGDYRMAMPNYPSGSPKGNSHEKHVIDNGVECITCHSVTLASNTVIGNHTTHVNMAYNIDIVAPYNPGSAYYDPAESKCYDVRCHGGNPTPVWGDPIGCEDCHFSSDDVDDFIYGSFTGIQAKINQSQYTTSGHGRAINTNFKTGNYGPAIKCQKCHDSTISHGDETNPFRLRTGPDSNVLCLKCHGTGTSFEIMDFAANIFGIPGPTDLVCEACHSYGTFGLVSSTHIPKNIRSHSFDGISEAGALQNHTTWRITPKCVDCHDPHGDGNMGMIHSKVNSGGSDGYGRPDAFFNKSTIVFASHSNTDSFATNSDTSVCQACHTQTGHFRQVGTPGASDPNHMNIGGAIGRRCTPTCHNHQGGLAHGYSGKGGAGGEGCVACHGHEEGTLYDPDMQYPYTAGTKASIGAGTTTPHSTHTEWDADDKRGPQIYCNICHDINNIPAFNSGTDSNSDGRIDLSETDVCDACHSPGGTFNGVNTTGGSVGAKENWHTGGVYNNGTSLKAGKENWCVGCHDETPSQIKSETAPNKVGDNSTYGFFVTGHGKAAGNYTTLSWQDTTATGNPAANRTCVDCHNGAAFHIISGTNPAGKRLKTGYENDAANSVCENCHKSTGVATAAPIWFTNNSGFEASAHGRDAIMNPYTARPIYCTDCHDVHGTVNRAMTKGNQETLCFSCHTEGGVVNDQISNNRQGGHNSADDIEEAFGKSEIHNLGTSFTNGGKTYSLECISCHNVHLVTGKYWDAEQNLSPITRPSNRTEVWGDDPNEKMDEYARTGGSGTGGFYWQIANGKWLGDTVLVGGYGAFYHPPKNGGGLSGYEFAGSDLPAYPAFCLDCHSDQMASDVGPINWGQGISCGHPEPPGSGYSNWVACGAPHGFGTAGLPTNGDDSGTGGFWGDNGNPDVLFDMNYVTRGRDAGHFMRMPYDSANRNAGINYVLSCTDCHEAHGSNRSSMIRERFQTNDNGGCGTGGTPGEGCTDGGNWNNFCNACHYYYGGHHAGMSCGQNSCHETYSIHRIKKNNLSGGQKLMLTSSGYEANFQPPTFTPEIETISARNGSDKLYVTFRESDFGAGTSGIFTNYSLTGALQPDDFWLIDKGSNNPRTITAVDHTPGDTTAILTTSQPTTIADMGVDTLSAQPLSIWGWYQGGYNNAATGILGAEAVSSGPWPVTMANVPLVESARYGRLERRLNGIVDDSAQIYVSFSAGAYANSDGTGDLQAADFIVNCGGRSITPPVAHTAGDNYAILTLDSLIDQSEIGVCTVAAAADSIFDVIYGVAETTAVVLSLPPEVLADNLVVNWKFDEGSGTTVINDPSALGATYDMQGNLTRNIQWVTSSTKPGAAAGDNAILLDRVSDRGAVQLNYTVNPGDGYPPATYNSGGAPVIVEDIQKTSEFSFAVWIKPTALGCQEGQDLGLNTKLRRDILTTQFWIKNWALGIMRFSDDGDPIAGNCDPLGANEDHTHDVLRFWVSAGDPADPRCDAWGGEMPNPVRPVSPTGYYQGGWQPANCQSGSANMTMPDFQWTSSFAQTETVASGAPTYGGVALQAGVWQHVVGKWDGRYIRIYIDGQLAAETDMGGTGSYVMLPDPHLWANIVPSRHVSSYFAVGARPIWSNTSNGSGGTLGADYWNGNGFYDLNDLTYVGEIDEVKYWNKALPLTTIQGP